MVNDTVVTDTKNESFNNTLPHNSSSIYNTETETSTLPFPTPSSSVIQETTVTNTHNVTNYTDNITTTYWPTSAPHDKDSGGTAVIVIISLLAVAASLVLIYLFLKRGKVIKFPCYFPTTRARRSSSSSSRRALEEHDVMDENFRQKPDGQADADMFTIHELENNEEPTGGREEYYYDEVFGQSQFEDEATNNAMRQLYSDSDNVPETEILDLDFETLGIKFQDNNADPVRKNTA